MTEPFAIDGSLGEGGGQVLRTSLALAAITGRAIRIDNVRARRAKPGLQRQHLACVLAAARVCNASVRGAVLGSGRVDFAPQAIVAGEYVFDIGTAGSTGLVVQTVLPILLCASGPSRVVVTGGTHNPLAPSYDFLARAFVPIVRRMGADVSIEIERYGFNPGGGGRVVCTIVPSSLVGLELVDGGAVTRRHARAVSARLPTHVCERELAVVQSQLGWRVDECAASSVDAVTPGNALSLEVERAGVVEIVTGFGEKGTRAELVASRACDELRAYLAHDAPVGEHLADQLLIPMALARGGRFRSAPLSRHARTNIEVVARFMDVRFDVAETADDVIVSVSSAHA
ncbi:MAG TPA: RNA 3'-terminal phosphate cyclase [Kofleriaceae bacterium]|nr:RNA 3'-terminal phosphate cyclase [Kofleriaceae bacterium]